MIKNNLISIIIPTFNRCNDLSIAINSIINQSYKNYEIIIIDNYSDDNTYELIKSFNDARIRFFRLHNFGNIALSRNLGIEKSKGNILAFLDSDDYWFDQKLEIAVSYFERGYDFFFSPMLIKHLNNFKVFKTSILGDNAQIKKTLFEFLLLNGNIISTSSVLVRKSILLNVGVFDTDSDLVTGEDFELWLRILHSNNNYYYYNKPLGVLTSSNNNSSNSIQSLVFLKYIFEKYTPYLNPNDIILLKKQWFDFAIIYHKWKCNYFISFVDILKTFSFALSLRKNFILFRILVGNL